MSDYVIKVENLGKAYTIRHQQERYTVLRDVLANSARRWGQRLLRPNEWLAGSAAEKETFWALQDVSFEVKQGERLGIIGRNGAGKSTLLKVLSRITEPTRGEVRLRGRVASLLEVGTGFHPELTGRENIYLNGAILGMTRAEIARKFDEIVAFAEVEKFLDTPVKRYSSGMYVRLAFAVAAHLEPDILLVDEVLAVGDAAFRRKSLQKMDDVARSGITVLFVSHDMNSIKHLCSQVMLLDKGNIRALGEADRIIRDYQELSAATSDNPLTDRTDRKGEGGIRLVNITFYDANEQSIGTAIAGEPLNVALDYVADQSFSRLDFAVGFRTLAGAPLFVCMASNSTEPFPIQPGSGRVWCRINHIPLADGSYSINVAAHLGSVLYDWVERAATLDVISADFYGNGSVPLKSHSPFLVQSDWRRDEHLIELRG